MAVTCKNCGGSHPVWECKEPAATKRGDAHASDTQGIPASLGNVQGRQPGGSQENLSPINPPKPKDRHRPGYYKEYMRVYRAKRKHIASVNNGGS